MRTTCLAVSVLLLLYLPAACAQQPAAEGSVAGTVVTELNVPIEGARVSLQVQTPTQINSYSTVQTDRSGHFLVEHVPLDTFGIIASKDEDGYSAFDAMKNQTVTLTSDAPLANVTIKLGPRQAMLAPTIRDKSTGERICMATIHWTAAGSRHGGPSSMSGGIGIGPSTTRISIPAGEDVLLTATARGFRPWVYLDPAGHPSVNLQPGEIKNVEIELESVPLKDGEAPRPNYCPH